MVKTSDGEEDQNSALRQTFVWLQLAGCMDTPEPEEGLEGVYPYP